MISVARRAVAGNLSIDLRAALLRTLEVFEDVDPRAFAEHDAGAVARERSRGARRLIVPLICEHGHQVKSGEDAGSDGRINAAREHRLLAA